MKQNKNNFQYLCLSDIRLLSGKTWTYMIKFKKILKACKEYYLGGHTLHLLVMFCTFSIHCLGSIL